MGALSQLATRQRSAGRASVIKGGCKCQSFSAQTKMWGGPCPIAEALWGGGRQEEHRRERLVLHRGRLEPGDGLSPLSVSFCPSSDTINTEH